jgi:uncharacterized membrane protein YeaQ/YmgE (transglycosylase-associated protein family)
MTVDSLIVLLLVGLVAGFLASHLVAGHGYGLAGDIIVGVLGALLAGFLLPRMGIVIGAGLLGLIIVAFIGAAILILILRLVTSRGSFGRRRML